ncbi:ARM repeat-containing protein, partial [Ramaria rubella]
MNQDTAFKSEKFLHDVSSYTLMLLKDERGSRFIQTCLGTQSDEQNEFIYTIITENCADIAIHKNTFSLLRHCIAHGTDLQRFRLVQELTRHVIQLVQHQFGNYIIQFLLDQNNIQFSEGIISRLAGNVRVLSTRKFSSLAIEKSICVAEEQSRRVLIDEVIESLDVLLMDPYGNYCVQQTALDYAEPTQRSALV